MDSRGMRGAVVIAALALTITACGADESTTTSPGNTTSPVAATTAVANVASTCDRTLPRTATLGEAVVKGTPASATYCRLRDASPRTGVALPPGRVLDLIETAESTPYEEPAYCPVDIVTVGQPDQGIVLTYTDGKRLVLGLQPGNCGAFLQPGEDFEQPVYIPRADLEWFVSAAGLDWLGKNGKQETAPPAPKVCPTEELQPRALEPVLAKGTPVAAAACTGSGKFVIEQVLEPKTTVKELRAALTYRADEDQACTAEADPPRAIAFTYRDGSRAHVVIDTSGCWSVVQKSGKSIWTAPDERRLDLPRDTAFGDFS